MPKINPIESVLKSHNGSGIVMIELPSEKYFEASAATIKTLVDQGYSGVYVSFQRPFKNIDMLLKQQQVDTKKLIFVDVATALGGETAVDDVRCIRVSSAIEIDELVRAIYTSMPALKSKKMFIFIDSLTTIALYKPLSEIMRFSEFLIRTVSGYEGNEVLLVFNVAKDLSQKKFIKEIALKVNDVVAVA